MTSGIPIAVKRITGQSHDLAGLGDVAKFLRQVQKSDFVFDDLLLLWSMCQGFLRVLYHTAHAKKLSLVI